MEKKIVQPASCNVIALDILSQAAMLSFQLDMFASRLKELGDISLKEERIQELAEKLEVGQQAIATILTKLQEIRAES